MAKQKQPLIESVEFYEAEGKHSTADFLLAAVKDYLARQEQIDPGDDEREVAADGNPESPNDTSAGSNGTPADPKNIS
jgi:hypothetical protein